MSFDSVTFWIFFAVAWAIWRFLPFGMAKTATVGTSLLFYGWWNPWFIGLIVFSAVVDYQAGGKIHSSDEARTRRAWLLVSLTANLGLLALFKYGPFIVGNLEPVAESMGYAATWDLSWWIVPVGISFYTFQTLSYSIDIYRRQLAPAQSFRDFLLYVSFFPQLVAGPIVRARSLIPQFRARRALSSKLVSAGFYYIILGLFLKIVIADNLAPIVNYSFDKELLLSMSPANVWLSVIYFAAQIFSDFAGYSYIAIGLAYLMGLHFPENFRWPYISSGLSEFWTRWHVSLSQWLRDYLYISMGGNRRGTAWTFVFLMTTMLLGGLWHGAAWTFVAWGAFHGLGLCVERGLRGGGSRELSSGPPKGAGDFLIRLIRIALVMVFVLTSWVFFRATDFEMVAMLLERMYVAPFGESFGFDDLLHARHALLLIPIVGLHLGQLAHEWYGVRANNYARAFVAALFLFFLTIVQRDAPSEFIYFQF